ncbi:EAL domain-containing protein, partial [Streptomyces albidoflavus]
TAGVLRIAADLGLQTVAEGVDRPEQVVALRTMGCTHAQGMAFAGHLDEYRLRRTLTHGNYALPAGPVVPAPQGPPHAAFVPAAKGGSGGPGSEPPGAGGGASLVTRRGAPAVVAQAAAAGMPRGPRPVGPHHETPVPPT